MSTHDPDVAVPTWTCPTCAAVFANQNAMKDHAVAVHRDDHGPDVVAVLAEAFRGVPFISYLDRSEWTAVEVALKAIADAGLAFVIHTPERNHHPFVIHTPERNRLAEAFIRGIEAGAEDPSLAGDGDATYQAFRLWADSETIEPPSEAP